MMNEPRQEFRICVVGDSFVLGTGDLEGLGWVGRVTRTLLRKGCNLTAYNLGVRGHTSQDILTRWEAECKPRFVDPLGSMLFFSFGTNDMFLEEETPKIPLNRSLKNFEEILTKARSTCPTFVIGPPPITDQQHNMRVRQLSEAYAHRAQALGIPYLSAFERLLNDGTWMTGLQGGDGAHPNSQGYEALANIILGWREGPLKLIEEKGGVMEEWGVEGTVLE